MSLVLSDSEVLATGLTEAELRLELAVTLFQQERLTMSQAARLGDRPLAEFMRILGGRGISPHYDVEEFREDMVVLERMSKR